jgi:hypothetical protein
LFISISFIEERPLIQALSVFDRRRMMALISRPLVAIVLLLWFSPYVNSQPDPRQAAAHKQRVVILTDIGAEADDTGSMVRLLLYSDVIDIQ